MESGFLEQTGKTELGAIKLTLTDKGRDFREKGQQWWADQNFLQKLKITLLG